MKMNDEFLRVFGQVIATKRKKIGISQEELASRSGLNRTYIGDIERGARNIALLNIKRLSLALGMSPSKLLTEVENTISRSSKP
jgi:transcriptional regulator with XRE-family HTH domain